MGQDANRLVHFNYEQGQNLVINKSPAIRKSLGQFLTPASLARFAWEQLGYIPEGSRILDPAVGSGNLLAALIEYLLDKGCTGEYWLEGYEIDSVLANVADSSLKNLINQVTEYGIDHQLTIHHRDFIYN